jgi:hypothetical protein
MTDTINLNEKFYTTTEASKEFGIPAGSIKWACQKNVINALKNNANRWLIPESEIKKYIRYRSFTKMTRRLISAKKTKEYELNKSNAYVLNEFWDNKEGIVTVTTYGVFTSFKQAFYALYELINHRLLAYRSHGNQVVFFDHYDIDDHKTIYITIYDHEYNNKIEYFIKSFKTDTVRPDWHLCFGD